MTKIDKIIRPKPVYKKVSQTEWFIFLIIACTAVLSFVATDTGAQSDGLLHIYFLDVGQGDGIFIDFNGNQILIDGGPDNKIIQELGRVMPFQDHSIDLIVLTHPHADHVTGLIEVLKRYKVDRIIENYVPYSTAEYAEWNKAKKGSEVMEARAGQVVDLGNGVKLAILFPYQSGAGNVPLAAIAKNAHDFMVITRLDYGNEGVLFMGDAEAKVESRLISQGASLSAQFLKIGHHGSKTSTMGEFIDAVGPEIAFIQVGSKNRYGHPHPSVLERLQSRGIKYYRTDISGTIELLLDGQNYKINQLK